MANWIRDIGIRGLVKLLEECRTFVGGALCWFLLWIDSSYTKISACELHHNH